MSGENPLEPNDPFELKTIALLRPINAHGEELTSLTLKVPTGKDVREIGYPYLMGDCGISMNAAVICRYISRLAEIPMSSVDQLSAPDHNEAAQAILGFFPKPEQLKS